MLSVCICQGEVGGRSMTQLERFYKMSAMGFYKYLLAIQDWVLELIMEHEKI